MARRRVLLFLKSLDAYSFCQSNGVSRPTNPKGVMQMRCLMKCPSEQPLLYNFNILVD
ncbi:hypothetical protein HanRHA438_Chr13g0580771 [Helianthus annuus]|nr:hypothetical protein HanRHA438_Chr13g0580771 [Helianthus annuus]